MTQAQIADKLDAIGAEIEANPERWTQGHLARSAKGLPIGYDSPKHGLRMLWESPSGEDVDFYPPAYDVDANLWPPVFAELDRRGLLGEFSLRLAVEVGVILVITINPSADASWRAVGQLITATPAQRLRALVKVIEQEERNG